MSEMSRDDLLRVVRRVYDERDPVPEGLVARMQEAAALAAEDSGMGLDLELMLLVERSGLVGVRGADTLESAEEKSLDTRAAAAAYTLRFVHGDCDLLLRIAPDTVAGVSRIDGWVVPPEAMTVRIIQEGQRPRAAVVSETGRFELTDLVPGLVHLRLEPHDAGRAAFATPTFEI